MNCSVLFRDSKGFRKIVDFFFNSKEELDLKIDKEKNNEELYHCIFNSRKESEKYKELMTKNSK